MSLPLGTGLAALASLSEGIGSVAASGGSGGSLAKCIGVDIGGDLLVTDASVAPGALVIAVLGHSPVVDLPLLVGVEA